MATKLVSMKIPKEKRDGPMQPSSLATEGPAYPYGLSLSLDTDSLEKLELDAEDLTVGTKYLLIAKVEVSSLSQSDSKDQGPYQSVGLQITDLCLESPRTGERVADRLYGGPKA